jgi:phage baseplate assembly protein W
MAGPDKSFLGTGWSFPPTFSRRTLGVEMVSDERDMRESLWILLSTSLGERVMLPSYGCELRDLVFRGMTTTLSTQLKTIIAQAVLFWEPRIDIDAIEVQTDPSQDGLLHVRLNYVVRATNVRTNLVYPFYLGEATIPAQGP